MTSGKEYRGRLPDGECVKIHVDGVKIANVEAIPGEDGLPYALPVLVDLQHNGTLDLDFDYVHEYGEEGLAKVANHLRAHGVGRCVATLTTSPVEDLIASMSAFNDVLNANDDLAALFPCFFQEGVFISPEDGWRGAHPRQWVKPPDYDLFKTIDDASGNRIRIVNAAPEIDGGLDYIERAVADGKLVTMVHCQPTAENVAEAVARGATLVTHFGNGAPAMIHRHRNPLWAYLNHPELRLGLICDGFHLPKDLVDAALKCKGLENCYPVSDAGHKSGLEPGTYTGRDGGGLVIEENGFLHMENSEMLAGAWFQLDRGVAFLVEECGMPFLEAWRQCSEIPAAIIDLTLPQIAPGQEASFVLARWDDGLVIDKSVHRGKAY